MSYVFEPWSQLESSLKLNAFQYRSTCENKTALSHWNIHSQWFSDLRKEIEGKWRGFRTERFMQLLEKGIMNSFGSKNKTDSSCLDHSVEQWFLTLFWRFIPVYSVPHDPCQVASITMYWNNRWNLLRGTMLHRGATCPLPTAFFPKIVKVTLNFWQLLIFRILPF